MSLLPVAPAHRLAERAAEQRWLVSSLWSEEAVGIMATAINENYVFTVYSRPTQTQARVRTLGRQARAYPVGHPSLDTKASEVSDLRHSKTGSSVKTGIYGFCRRD